MKEIKAFVRTHKTDKIIDALEELGVTDFTIVDVMGVGEHLVDKEGAKYSIRIIQKYSGIAKLELVCKAVDVERIVKTIREIAYSGMRGDGIIYVTPVELLMKIRTGAVGNEVL